MLVLSRKPGERIHIGDDIVITLVRVGPNNSRIGIEAPRGVSIRREEIDQPAINVVDNNNHPGTEATRNVEKILA